MKLVAFISKNIVHFFKSEKLLSMLLIVGMIVCDTIFLVFGNTFWADTKKNKYEIYANNIVTLQFDELNIDDFIDRVWAKEYVTSISFSHTEYSETSTTVVSAYYPEFDTNMAGRFIGKRLSDSNKDFLINDDFLDEQDLTGALRIKIGDSLTFVGKERTCVGIISTGIADKFDFLIGVDDFKENIKNSITVIFRFKEGTSLIEVRELANEISSELDAQYMFLPTKTATISFSEFLSDMSGMLVLLIIAIINYMFIYRYMLMKRTFTYGIYKMLGMNNAQMLSLLSIEMMILLMISYLLSIFIFMTGLALRSKLGTMVTHIPELGFAFVIILVLNILFFIITSVRIIKNSPNQLIRESELK